MPNIVHLGLGNFHRAHQAWYTSRTKGWSITGVVMSNQQLYTDLISANNNYLLGTWSPSGLSTEVISVFHDVLLATTQAATVIEKIIDSDTHIVSLTITEKGYFLNKDRTGLDTNATPIANDLQSDPPKSAIGMLCMGLVKRMQSTSAPLNVMSCDNLATNGSVLQTVVTDFIKHKYPDHTEIIQWLTSSVTFPCSMVDRITPRPSRQAIEKIRAHYQENLQANVSVENPTTREPKNLPVVITESFSEWIITDNFAAARPDWERGGAILTQDLHSYEQRKLRLLNAAHSYLAYAGLSAGYRYVHEAINDAQLIENVRELWAEADITIRKPAADALDQYQSDLLERFSVVELRHELIQIAADGSLKLQERVLPIIQKRSELQLGSPISINVYTQWLAYVFRTIETGGELNDPQADKITKLINTSDSYPSACQAIAQLVGLPIKLMDQLSDSQN